MSKGKNQSPPITGNPRLGKETATDASVAWGGARLPGESKQPGVAATSKPPGAPATSKTSKGKKRSNVQTKLTLTAKQRAALKELMTIYGETASNAAGHAFIEQVAAVKKRLE